MEHMLTATSNNPAAAGAGLVAMVCFVACPLCCTQATMLMAYIATTWASSPTTLFSDSGLR